MRDCPTAKSHMSIISCTSPSPSARILPISSETRRPSASLWVRRALPSAWTTSPRFGAGHIRHQENASVAVATTRSKVAASAWRTAAIGSPVVGLSDTSSFASSGASQPLA